MHQTFEIQRSMLVGKIENQQWPVQMTLEQPVTFVRSLQLMCFLSTKAHPIRKHKMTVTLISIHLKTILCSTFCFRQSQRFVTY